MKIEKLLNTNPEHMMNKLNEIINALNAQMPVEPLFPRSRDLYYFLNDDGCIFHSTWDDSELDRERRDFTGIYRTESEAIEAKERIIKAIQNV